MVPVDGSNMAIRAFGIAAKILKCYDKSDKDKNDKLIVYHVTNPGRYKEMAASFHPDTIQGTYDTEAIKLDINHQFNIQFVTEEKADENDKIREKIRRYADEHADCVIMGSFGYKKAQQEDFASIGTTTALVTTGCKAVAVVVPRDACAGTSERKRFLAAVDGSDMSHCAVEEGLRYMQKGDYMQLVYVETDQNTSGYEIVKKYDQWLCNNKVKGCCKVVKKSPGVSIADEILDVAEGEDPLGEFGKVDMIIMGSNGLSHALPPRTADAYDEYYTNARLAHRKGSVAEGILTGVRKSCVMVVTVDSLLSGAVKSMDFKDWFSK